MNSTKHIQEEMLGKNKTVQENTSEEILLENTKKMFRECLEECDFEDFERYGFERAFSFFDNFYPKICATEIGNIYIKQGINRFIERHAETFGELLYNGNYNKDEDYER